jgi:alpha,alpha-trehalase
MAPLLTHPPGMNFVGDALHEQRPINADASEYYGGTEYHSRSRTYSTVRASTKWFDL